MGRRKTLKIDLGTPVHPYCSKCSSPIDIMEYMARKPKFHNGLCLKCTINIEKKSNMYGDSKKQWNVCVGCGFNCTYCLKSFQAQMKRQMPKYNEEGELVRGCQDCYDYTPHFHKNRLNDPLPKTTGDEFIWACSSGDISFFPNKWIEQILEVIKTKHNDKTFFFQSKSPSTFERFDFPNNIILGTTIESNRYYPNVSRAPLPYVRYSAFKKIDIPRKIVTIEPIMAFDLWTMVNWIENINPERVYIGYDTRNSGLIEPTLTATKRLISHLQKITTVKLKYIPKKSE